MPKPAGDRTSLYLCYARDDNAFAGEIFSALRERGIAAWMDRPPEAFQLEGFLPGQDAALQIEQRISEADALLLLLSRASIAQQGYLQAEFRLALHAAERRRLPVVAVLQGTCTPPTLIAGSVSLDRLAWIDHAASGIDAIVDAISTLRAPADKSPSSGRVKQSGAILKPRTRWRAYTGRLHWRNTLQIEDGLLYLTSCGARWNQDDRGDGVYCLDADSGALVWAFNSAGDANEALVHDNRVAVGTDAGQFALIDMATGRLIRDHRVWHPVFARPFVLGTHIFAVSHKGVVLMADPTTDEISEVANLPFFVRANPTVSVDGRFAILFGETGEIARVSHQDGSFQCEVLARKSYQPPGETKRRNAGLVAAPVLDGDCVIGGATRDSYYSAPPLFRFDLSRKSFLWGEHAQEPRDAGNSFGNLRSRALVMGEEVIFAPAYAAALYAADRTTGEIRWKLSVGTELLQQWSAPVQVDAQRVLLARADGILYQIDVAARKIEWALSLLVTPSEVRTTNRAGKLGPGPSEAAHNGITATPLWHDGRIYLGTTEGQLFCIEEAG